MRPVRRRCVFYVSGFDPKGAAHYHGLYREQARLQRQAGGLAIEVGARRRLADGNACWDVQATEAGEPVRTHYEFMRWDDIVRRQWARGRPRLWGEVLVASLFHLGQGSWWRMFRLSWPPAVAILIPFLAVCALLLGAPLLAAGAAWGAHALAGSWLAALPAVALVLLALARLERRLDARFNMYWLVRSYAFTRLQALGRTPALEARLDAHARKLAERLASGQDDEVLVVGHSSGAIMAASIVARALALQAAPARVSLLTLGQCIPMLSTVPQAGRFREELWRLGQSEQVHWVDFSAPPDASCFALCDPLAGLDGPAPHARGPKLLSPKFAQMFAPEGYRLLKRDKLRMHFQYLMAAPQPVAYDYFRITAGRLSLQERFAAQASVTDFATLRPFGAPA